MLKKKVKVFHTIKGDVLDVFIIQLESLLPK